MSSMPLGRNDNHYTLRTKRLCTQCRQRTDQTATSCCYSTPGTPKIPPTQIKRIEWVCDWCGNSEEEVKEVVEPSDKVKLIKRLLSLHEDYDILSMDIGSDPNVLLIRIRFPDYDMGELRAIQWKQRETGFITVDELIKVQQAGYRQPKAVPPKPPPRDAATLRKLERQMAFAGNSRH